MRIKLGNYENNVILREYSCKFMRKKLNFECLNKKKA